ncbi:unnamed protein product [Symbiodinium natans]|uniref:Uncharacterized protein n=1 Tax=Symbiodinium natans TaxID=878477 RepID=A0A812IMR1_9DINO|nr:unnamed protein product [Symbiodinium natans]
MQRSVVFPLTDLLPGHQVAYLSVKSSAEKITDIQAEFAKMSSMLASLDYAVDELGEQCRDFTLAVHGVETLCMAPNYESSVSRSLGNLSNTIGNMTNITAFEDSAA